MAYRRTYTGSLQSATEAIRMVVILYSSLAAIMRLKALMKAKKKHDTLLIALCLNRLYQS